MKTASLNTVSLINNVSQDKTLKQGNSEQSGTSFSNVIGSISVANQKTVTNLTNSKATNTTDSKNTKSASNTDSTSNPKDSVNAVVKDKLDNCENVNEATSKQSEVQETQNAASDITNDDEQNSKEVLDEASEKIKNILLDVLKISEEDLKSAMEVLGLEYLDCLDKNNLAQLLTQVSGNTDMSVLITDENLYQQFNDVLTLVNDVKTDILAELGITEEQLMTTLEQLNTNNLVDDAATVETDNVTNTSQTKDLQVIVENAKESVLTNVSTKEETIVNQDKTVTDVENEITNVTTTKVNTDTSTTQDGGEQQLAGNKEEVIAKQPDTLELGDTVEKDFHQYVLGQGKQENVVNNNLENVVSMNEKPTVDVESIVKQIQNQIKVTANMDTTKLEFQLNPEHLGKLSIQIASKEGTVTAQIAAQNLAVKEVLESQIVQLRENMNNQGLKVDAVEVTVESHEFERNLDDGSRSAEQQQFEQQQKNSRRQLNYNDLTTLEDLSEDEALIAEMMIGNGNSINYTA